MCTEGCASSLLNIRIWREENKGIFWRKIQENYQKKLSKYRGELCNEKGNAVVEYARQFIGKPQDRDNLSAALPIHVYVDVVAPGHGLGVGIANLYRPDVNVTFMDADSFVDVDDDYEPAELYKAEALGVRIEMESSAESMAYINQISEAAFKEKQYEVLVRFK